MPLLCLYLQIDLEFISSLAGSNGEGHVDAAENIVGVGLAIEQSLAFIVTLKKQKTIKNITSNLY
jgi:hypothetical protein